MRPRLSDVVAFVVGATIAIVMSLFYDTGSFYDDASVFPSIVLRFLCPGFLLGAPLAAPFTSGMGLDGLGFTILVMALVNGLLFGLAWYFGGIAAKGSKVALLVIVVSSVVVVFPVVVVLVAFRITVIPVVFPIFRTVRFTLIVQIK